MMYNIAYKCDSGQAPTEETVDVMFKNLDRHISYRKPNYKLVDERIHWANMCGNNDMLLQIVREVE